MGQLALRLLQATEQANVAGTVQYVTGIGVAQNQKAPAITVNLSHGPELTKTVFVRRLLHLKHRRCVKPLNPTR